MSSAIQYSFPASIPWSEKLVAKLSEREYRHAYMVAGVKTWIARQVRTLREQRGWSQDDLGREANKPQSAISRLEDPDYGKLTLQTLFDLARAYDVPLLVQFVEWSDWLSRTNDTSTASLQKESFSAQALTDVGVGQVGVTEQLAEQAWTEFAKSQENLGWRSSYNVPHHHGVVTTNLDHILGRCVVQNPLSGGLAVYGHYNWDVATIEYEEEEAEDEDLSSFDTPANPSALLRFLEAKNG